MPRIKRVGHVVLFARDPDASARWYGDILGTEVMATYEPASAVFLSLGRRDHDIALFKAPEDRALGHHDLEHVAFEIDGDLEDFKRFHARLVEAGVTIKGVVDHGISYGIYFLDPDGHQLEVYFQRIPDGLEAKRAFADIGAKAAPIEIDAITG